jgi:hypothetical protein
MTTARRNVGVEAWYGRGRDAGLFHRWLGNFDQRTATELMTDNRHRTINNLYQTTSPSTSSSAAAPGVASLDVLQWAGRADMTAN